MWYYTFLFTPLIYDCYFQKHLFSFRSQSLESEVHAHYPEVVAVKVAGQNLPTTGAQASAASPRKTVPERYDELASKMSQYETELQTSVVTTKTVKDDAKNLLKWLVEIKKQLEGLRPFQEDIDLHQNKILQFKVLLIVAEKLGYSLLLANVELKVKSVRLTPIMRIKLRGRKCVFVYNFAFSA